MNRINALRSIKNTNLNSALNNEKTAGALVFAAILVICSVTVGCSSEQPKPISNNTQLPSTPVPAPLPMLAENKPAETKPVPKKVVHKRPATVNYTDKTNGVTFEYPRRYAIETGTAATDLLQSSPIPMNFIAPGGVAVAAVELPETSFTNTDFSSAFFNVSVHKSLTPDQCNEFAVPAPKVVADQAPATPSSEVAATQPANSSTTGDTNVQPEPQGSKLLLGDMELRATEAVTGEGARQSDSKYFHVYQNGACYEFALNVTTVASADGLIRHVDRDRVFDRLEKILATVKISEAKISDVKTSDAKPEQDSAAVTPVAPAVAESPAQ